MATIVTNVWDHITIWCLNHDKPVEMRVMQNTEVVKTPFYMCDGTSASGCANRLNLDDYQDIVLKFFEIKTEKPFADLTNYSFSFKGHRHAYHVKILKYKDKDIRLGIKNKTILGG